jgi:hypothetical protein
VTEGSLYFAKDAVQCPDQTTCFLWAALYQNIQTVLEDLNMKIFRVLGDWTDKNKRTLLCNIEGGYFKTYNLAMKVKTGTPF